MFPLKKNRNQSAITINHKYALLLRREFINKELKCLEIRKAFVLTAQAVLLVWFCLCLWKCLASLQAKERNKIYNRYKKQSSTFKLEEIGLWLSINVLHNSSFISSGAVPLASMCNLWWKLSSNCFLQTVISYGSEAIRLLNRSPCLSVEKK